MSVNCVRMRGQQTAGGSIVDGTQTVKQQNEDDDGGQVRGEAIPTETADPKVRIEKTMLTNTMTKF